MKLIKTIEIHILHTRLGLCQKVRNVCNLPEGNELFYLFKKRGERMFDNILIGQHLWRWMVMLMPPPKKESEKSMVAVDLNGFLWHMATGILGCAALYNFFMYDMWALHMSFSCGWHWLFVYFYCERWMITLHFYWISNAKNFLARIRSRRAVNIFVIQHCWQSQTKNLSKNYYIYLLSLLKNGETKKTAQENCQIHWILHERRQHTYDCIRSLVHYNCGNSIQQTQSHTILLLA